MPIKRPDPPVARSWTRLAWRLLPMTAMVTAMVVGIAAWTVFSTWRSLVAAGAGIGIAIAAALWTLGLSFPLHLLQLLLSSIAWRGLLPGPAPPTATLFRLRIIREAIDGLLPVAQIGGEVVGAGLLAERGVPTPIARASVIVDLTFEVLTQVVFLLAGLLTLSALDGGHAWRSWAGLAIGATGVAILLLLAQGFGVLRLMESMVRRIAERFPPFAGASLAGLETAAHQMYREPLPLLRASLLHLVAWMGGTLETWLVLYALHQPVGLAQAFVIESLGMAARSAGFAVPGALGVQEGGFMLASAMLGLPQQAGLALSLLKRVREVLLGTFGLGLWRVSGRVFFFEKKNQKTFAP